MRLGPIGRSHLGLHDREEMQSCRKVLDETEYSVPMVLISAHEGQASKQADGWHDANLMGADAP